MRTPKPFTIRQAPRKPLTVDATARYYGLPVREVAKIKRWVAAKSRGK